MQSDASCGQLQDNIVDEAGMGKHVHLTAQTSVQSQPEALFRLAHRSPAEAPQSWPNVDHPRWCDETAKTA